MATAALLAIASGILLALSFPPANAEWIAWLALAPLFIAAQRRSFIETLGLGIFAGMTCGFVIARSPGAASLSLAYAPFALLSLVLGVTVATTRLQMPRDGLLWPFAVACLGVTMELISTFSPLPIHLGLTQHRNIPLLQIVGLAGIWIVSFLVWWGNAVVASILLYRRLTWSALVSVPLIGMVYPFDAQSTIHSEPSVRVAAIQDYEGTMDSGPDRTVNVADREALTRQAAKQGARLIVWSELGLGTAFDANDENDPTRQLARELNVFLVAGYIEGAPPRRFNSAALIGPDGRVLAVHHKQRLFLGERLAYQRGATEQVVATPIGRLGIEICFDGCFTHLTRRLAQRGAELIAIPNFDPPPTRRRHPLAAHGLYAFPRGGEPRSHCARRREWPVGNRGPQRAAH